jgi:predicted esterase
MLRSPPAMRRILLAFVVALVALIALIAPRAAWAKGRKAVPEPLRLPVPGAPDAYYYRPQGKGLQPILMYLHGRGGRPAADCQKWARVGTAFGWVVCPSGPGDNGNGGRTWLGPGDAQRVIDGAVTALRAKYKGRVQLRDNLLIGFSEGAFVAMNVGLKNQRRWTKWLILGASDQYWGGAVDEELEKKARKVQRVYLLTGERDGVAPKTKRVADALRKLKVPVKVNIVSGLGHEVPSDKMITTYRRPLLWLFAKKR